jgi:hypothetical protein
MEPKNEGEDITLKTSEKYGLPICLVIACIGTITNTISISFFLRRISKNLGSKFLVLLNSVDMVISIYTVLAAGATVVLNHDGKSDKFPQYVLWFFSIFELLIEFSGLVTSFLCGLRAISIKWPLYQISKSRVYASFILVAMYSVTCKLILFHPSVREHSINKFYDKKFSITTIITFVNMSASVLFVLICSVFTVRALQKVRPELAGERSDRNDKATKMVLLLGLLFLIFNSTWLSVLAYDLRVGNFSDSAEVTSMIIFVTISANSSVNPIVYMTRNEEMNRYVKEAVSKVTNVILCKKSSADTVTAMSDDGLGNTSAAV